jgi:hypothetical protein
MEEVHEREVEGGTNGKYIGEGLAEALGGKEVHVFANPWEGAEECLEAGRYSVNGLAVPSRHLHTSVNR